MIVEPPFGRNGHGMFAVKAAIPIWLPHFEQFLAPLVPMKQLGTGGKFFVARGAPPMLTTLAINNYRSIREIVIPLTRLNLIIGSNGSGKSNLYRALRLLAATAQDGIVAPLALEGGLKSVVWAGPDDRSGRMRRGEIPVQARARGTPPPRLRLGFSGEDFGYAVSMGLVSHDSGESKETPSSFALDPEFKRESIWAGPFLRRANLLIDREGSVVRRKSDAGWDVLTQSLPRYESLFSQVGKDELSPEVFAVREAMRSWRFYDHFRIDTDAPARRPQIGTRTLVLNHDGRTSLPPGRRFEKSATAKRWTMRYSMHSRALASRSRLSRAGCFLCCSIRKDYCGADRRRIVRRHASLSVACHCALDCEATRSDGAQRT